MIYALFQIFRTVERMVQFLFRCVRRSCVVGFVGNLHIKDLPM